MVKGRLNQIQYRANFHTTRLARRLTAFESHRHLAASGNDVPMWDVGHPEIALRTTNALYRSGECKKQI